MGGSDGLSYSKRQDLRLVRREAGVQPVFPHLQQAAVSVLHGELPQRTLQGVLQAGAQPDGPRF